MQPFQIMQDNHADSVIEVYSLNGVPVLAHEGGRYPSLRLADGGTVSTSGTLPFVDVARFHGGWAVTLRIEPTAGHDRSWPFAKDVPDFRAAAEEAARSVERVKAAWSGYETLMGRVHALGLGRDAATRELYEAACAETGIAPLDDGELARADHSPMATFPHPHADPASAVHAYAGRWRSGHIRAEAEAEREASRLEAERAGAARRTALVESLATAPVVRRYTDLVLGGSAVGHRFVSRGELHEVAEVLGRRKVTEDDPSMYGGHLLGYEGTYATEVRIAVRARPD